MVKIIGPAKPKIIGLVETPEDNDKKINDLFKQLGRAQAKTSLSNILGKGFDKTPIKELASKVGYGAIPAVENLPGGIKEGFGGALAALMGKEYQNEPESDEYGAGFGRGLGQMIGQGVVAAPAAALIGSAGAALGAPALLAELGGTGLAFGATTPGNVLDRVLAGAEAMGLHGAGKLVGGAIKGTLPTKEISKRTKNAFNVFKTRAKKERALEDIESSEGAVAHSEEELNRANQILQEIEKSNKPHESEMRRDLLLGTTHPDTLARKAESLKEDKASIERNLSKEPEMDIAQMPPKPIIEPTIDESQLPKAESLLESAQEKAAKQEESIGEYLNKGKAHKKRTGKAINEALEKKQAEIGAEYEAFEEANNDKYITIHRNDESKNVLGHIVDNLEKNPTNRKEVMKLNEELDSSGDTVHIPAGQFVSTYRSLRHMANKTRASAYGETPVEHDRLIARANEMDDDVERMQTLINSNLDSDTVKKLHKIDKRYATEFAPVYEDDFYKYISKYTTAPSNMIEQLSKEPFVKSTSKKQVTGNKIIKDIIKNDPEILKNILGEKFSQNPSLLHQENELVSEYLDLMPELKNMLKQHKGHLENIEQSTINLEKAKERFSKEKESAKKQTKLNKEEVSRREKVSSLYDNMIKLDADASKIEAAVHKAEQMAKQKNIGLEEKISAEKKLSDRKKELAKIKQEYKKIERQYKQAKKDIYTVGAIGTAYIGGKKVKNWLMD